MNYTYLIIMVLFTACTVYEISRPCRQQSDGRIVVSLFGATMLLVFSIVPLFLKEVVTVKAESTKVGNQIVVQSAGNPTHLVESIKFDGVPLQVVRSTWVNAYGCLPSSTYEVQVIVP